MPQRRDLTDNLRVVILPAYGPRIIREIHLLAQLRVFTILHERAIARAVQCKRPSVKTFLLSRHPPKVFQIIRQPCKLLSISYMKDKRIRGCKHILAEFQ